MSAAKNKKTPQAGKSAQSFDFFAVADESPAMIWVSGTDKLCNWFNKGWLEFTGRSMEQELGNGWTEGVHPDDLQRSVDAYAQHFDAREHFLLEYRLRRHDSEYRWILDSGAPRYTKHGKFLGYNGICFDIHERKQYEEVQRRQTEFINAILDCEPECVMVDDAEGKLVMMNRAGLDMLEVATFGDARLLGMAHFVVPEHREAYGELHKRVIAGERDVLEFEIIGEKGTRRWLETHAAPLHDKNGKITALIGITRDVTERRALQTRLEHQAHTDFLTGLPNRGRFFGLAELELNRVERYGGLLSLLMLDIDRFKDINDTYGHKAGDMVLMTLARVCRATLREVDVIGRIGGDEFAILLPETDSVKAFDVAQRLCQTVAAAHTSLPDGRSLLITTSIGVTQLNKRGMALDMLIQQADQALYGAKRAGGNCVCPYA